MQWVTGIVRFFQFLFGVVVLGLSVTLLLGQHWLSPPAATKYAIFTGAFGMLAALVGVAALYLDRLPGFVIWAVDGLAGAALLAGGIAFAAILGGADCFNARETSTNQLLSGGCWDFEGRKGCWHMANFDTDALEMRCMSAKADSAFMFLCFATSLAAIACSVFLPRKGDGGPRYTPAHLHAFPC